MARFERFPFVVVYVVEVGFVVKVLAVFHTSRNPIDLKHYTR